MIGVDEARLRMLEAISPLAAERVGIGDVEPGRVLARDVVAGRDQPPFDVSAMDGWAVRREDLPGTLAIVGQSAAGEPYRGVVGSGQAVRIFTGAHIPQGADTVVIQEEATAAADTVRIESAKPGANIRARGNDFQAGAVVLAAGRPVKAWDVALAVAAGAGELWLARSPRVALLACGDELVAAGDAAAPHQIHDSITPALAMKVRGWGGQASAALLADALEAVRDHIAACEADLIVTVGGASVGDRDLIKPALAELGAELLVSKVAVRPGKPVFFAVLPDGRKVLGLPGNPASAMVCAELFLWPLMRAMQGGEPHRALESLPLMAPLAANGPREHWMRARIGLGGVAAFADQDSSLVSVLSAADALIRRLPGAAAAGVGEAAQVLRLA
jgi:molybdopterin molybdotransferase